MYAAMENTWHLLAFCTHAKYDKLKGIVLHWLYIHAAHKGIKCNASLNEIILPCTAFRLRFLKEAATITRVVFVLR